MFKYIVGYLTFHLFNGRYYGRFMNWSMTTEERNALIDENIRIAEQHRINIEQMDQDYEELMALEEDDRFKEDREWTHAEMLEGYRNVIEMQDEEDALFKKHRPGNTKRNDFSGYDHDMNEYYSDQV